MQNKVLYLQSFLNSYLCGLAIFEEYNIFPRGWGWATLNIWLRTMCHQKDLYFWARPYQKTPHPYLSSYHPKTPFFTWLPLISGICHPKTNFSKMLLLFWSPFGFLSTETPFLIRPPIFSWKQFHLKTPWSKVLEWRLHVTFIFKCPPPLGYFCKKYLYLDFH